MINILLLLAGLGEEASHTWSLGAVHEEEGSMSQHLYQGLEACSNFPWGVLSSGFRARKHNL